MSGECKQCKDKKGLLQRRSAHESSAAQAPPIVHEVLRSPGQPLDLATRALMEPRFGYDFSQVRVHTDAKAAESAQEVNALAYTVGRDVVFGAAQYAPKTVEGRRLLAHELAHTVQQSGANTLPVDERPLEAEADRAEADVINADGLTSVVSRSGFAVLKQKAGSQPQPPQPLAPNKQQLSVVESARLAAAIRTQVALMRVGGIVPPGPPGRPDPAQEMRQRARSLARVMFKWDNPNMDQIEKIVSDMVSRLTNPQVMVAGNGDPECGNRAAYVRGLQPPIILCPAFFNNTPEERTRTMIHEAAHLARIGSAALGGSCDGFDSADSWAQFVHCLSGQAPDQPDVIQGRQPSGQGPKPGGGGGSKP